MQLRIYFVFVIVQHPPVTAALVVLAPGGLDLYSAQCKWRNGENNRTLTLTLFLTPNLTLIDYFRHCAICIAPNTDSPPGAVLYNN